VSQFFKVQNKWKGFKKNFLKFYIHTSKIFTKSKKHSIIGLEEEKNIFVNIYEMLNALSYFNLWKIFKILV